MAKLYYVEANAYDMVIADDGDTRWVFDAQFFENDSVYETKLEYGLNSNEHLEAAKEFLKKIEDYTSWEQYEETVEELTKDCEILAETEF